MTILARIKKMKTLKFNPSSVDQPGAYRWFQSKHPVVNEIVNEIQEANNVTFSKCGHALSVNAIELRMGLKPTQSAKELESCR